MLLSIFVKTLATILKGILIGISLSAPLGPVGSLCLKKTLFEGRRDGILTGYGATVSDMLYSAIVYIFFGYMLTFLDSNPELMTGLKSFGGILGGIILMIFARLLSNRARKKIQKEDSNAPRKDEWKKFLAAFLLTFSNFWIIFLIWSLYMTFGFVLPLESLGNNYLAYFFLTIVAILSIGAGCLLWWYFFTDIIIRISRSLGEKGIKWFVYGISLVLGIFGLFGILLGLDAIINWTDILQQVFLIK